MCPRFFFFFFYFFFISLLLSVIFGLWAWSNCEVLYATVCRLCWKRQFEKTTQSRCACHFIVTYLCARRPVQLVAITTAWMQITVTIMTAWSVVVWAPISSEGGIGFVPQGSCTNDLHTLYCCQYSESEIIIIMIIIIIIIIIVMSVFLVLLSTWNMLSCDELVQIQKYKHMHIRHPKQQVSKQLCSNIQLSS